MRAPDAAGQPAYAHGERAEAPPAMSDVHAAPPGDAADIAEQLRAANARLAQQVVEAREARRAALNMMGGRARGARAGRAAQPRAAGRAGRAARREPAQGRVPCAARTRVAQSPR